jgi:preprotein translocase subunit SecG
MFTARGAANFLTRLTAILAGLFMFNCLLMSIVAGRHVNQQSSFLDQPANSQQTPPPPADAPKK